MYIPENNVIMTSNHVLFDESIPPKSEVYWKELKEALAIEVEEETDSVEAYQWLVGTYQCIPMMKITYCIR